MAITTAICSSFKDELMSGQHNFATSGGDTFKLALFTNSATWSATTTDYSTSNEVATSGTYSAGGGSLSGRTLTGGATETTAYVDFTDLSFTGATITAAGCMIYNTTTGTSTGTTESVCVIDFSGDKTCTAGTFTIQFPANTATTAILRLA